MPATPPAPAIGHPPPPWNLHGPLRTAQLTTVHPLRPPPGLRPLLPRTMLLLLGSYHGGSTLTYNELVLCSYARKGLRTGLAIQHIWVDNDQAVHGGRHIWGLDKHHAAFQWSHDRVRISDNRGTVAELRCGSPRRPIPGGALPLPFFGLDGTRLLRTVARGRGPTALCPIMVTHWSPHLPALAAGPRGPRVRLSLLCDPSRVTVPAPQVLT
ncbi:acetoacetate decarboxylase family protein [Streptomyces sp. NPDC001404]|uniref:acetoacetate decarboxylase family protein n=1 Tax=Streptomyces sp. NPDC001404 TaxID=3364571 RepID=UPI003685FD3B